MDDDPPAETEADRVLRRWIPEIRVRGKCRHREDGQTLVDLAGEAREDTQSERARPIGPGRPILGNHVSARVRRARQRRGGSPRSIENVIIGTKLPFLIEIAPADGHRQAIRDAVSEAEEYVCRPIQSGEGIVAGRHGRQEAMGDSEKEIPPLCTVRVVGKFASVVSQNAGLPSFHSSAAPDCSSAAVGVSAQAPPAAPKKRKAHMSIIRFMSSPFFRPSPAYR